LRFIVFVTVMSIITHVVVVVAMKTYLLDVNLIARYRRNFDRRASRDLPTDGARIGERSFVLQFVASETANWVRIRVSPQTEGFDKARERLAENPSTCKYDSFHSLL